MSDWSNPVVSFASATVTGGYYSGDGPPAFGTPVDGTVIDYERVMSAHAMQISVTDASGTGYVSVALYGSLDGENWYAMAAPTYTGNDTAIVAVTDPAQYVQVVATSVSAGPVATTFSADIAVLVIAQER